MERLDNSQKNSRRTGNNREGSVSVSVKKLLDLVNSPNVKTKTIQESFNPNLSDFFSIPDVVEVSNPKESSRPVETNIKTKTWAGKPSIFVESFTIKRRFRARGRFNYYDSEVKQFEQGDFFYLSNTICVRSDDSSKKFANICCEDLKFIIHSLQT